MDRDSARYVRVTDGFMTWHAGYQTPAGTYVAVEQTIDPNRAWVEAQMNRAPRVGNFEAGSHLDEVRAGHQGAEQPARRPADLRDLTTLVTGTATFEEMAEFVTYLEPVGP